MRKYKLTVNIAVFIIFGLYQIGLQAQGFEMSGTLGIRTDYHNSSSGFMQTIGLRYANSKRFSFGLTIGHAFTESRSQIFDGNDSKSYIRHVDVPIPDGVINGTWNANSFPDIVLPAKGNRYDDLFLSLSVGYKVLKASKYNIHASIGVGIHKHDQSEQISQIEPHEIYWVIGGHRTYENIIPIYAYNTYLDLSVVPLLVYEYRLKSNLGLTFESAAFYYPMSKSLSMSQSFGFRLQL